MKTNTSFNNWIENLIEEIGNHTEEKRFSVTEWSNIIQHSEIQHNDTYASVLKMAHDFEQIHGNSGMPNDLYSIKLKGE